MLTDMMPLIFQGAFVIGIIIAIVHVLKIRNNGADPMMIDALTGGERFLAIISGLLGGIIVVGLIYYFGLKKRFPTKAWQVLKMFLWMIGIAILVFIAAFAIIEYQQQQARQGLRDAVERVQQQQELLGDIIPGYSESPTSNTQPESTTQASGSQTSPASSGTASVVSGAQTVPQDSQGPYGDPRGSMIIKGTAPVAAIEAFIIRSAIENEIPDTTYATLYNMQWAGTGPLNVSNGTYSGKVKVAKGSYVVFVYDQASRRLLAKGNINLNIDVGSSRSAKDNNAPVVTSLTGPISLRVGEKGTWLLTATDDTATSLKYSCRVSLYDEMQASAYYGGGSFMGSVEGTSLPDQYAAPGTSVAFSFTSNKSTTGKQYYDISCDVGEPLPNNGELGARYQKSVRFTISP